MRDQIKITVNYFRLKKYLIERLNYSEKAAVTTINDVRRMVPEVRKAFLVWFTTGKKPQGELCGIHYNNLVVYRKMNPVAAFLAVDWYVKDPKAAYATIAMPLKDDGNKLVAITDDMKAAIDQLYDDTKIEQENTEDITG